MSKSDRNEENHIALMVSTLRFSIQTFYIQYVQSRFVQG